MNLDPRVEDALDRVVDLLGREIGLRPQSGLRGRLRRCIDDQAAARGEEVADYVDHLSVRSGAFQSLLNQVTVQETSFFRHPEHFAVLARDVLPTLSQPIDIWSAGCANGQEAFSLAMLLAELHLDGTVLATDLSTDALARTAAASYTTKELSGLSAERVERHLRRTGNRWTINAGLRARVRIARHNLIEALPDQARSTAVVFCRNVLIYFDPGHTRIFLDRLADTLPAAVVFLGSAETMWSVTDHYRTVQADESYYYRCRTAPTSTPLPAPLPASRSGPQRQAPPARLEAHHGPRTALERTNPLPATPPASGISPQHDTDEAVALGLVGQRALERGDHRSAVVAFRKCTYLTPDDPVAHLHLGLAFEASGDARSATRAFATAARTALAADSEGIQHALGGYTTAELLRLLHSKHLDSKLLDTKRTGLDR